MPSLLHFRCQLGRRRIKKLQIIIPQCFADDVSRLTSAEKQGSSTTDFRQRVEASPIFDILPALLMLLRQIELRF